MKRKSTARSGTRSSGSYGRVRVMANRGGRKVVVPPATVPEGRTRCPVCRNTPRLNPSGRLRRHNDLFGLTCYNVAPPAP